MKRLFHLYLLLIFLILSSVGEVVASSSLMTSPPALMLDASGTHTCALVKEKVTCWGSNQSNQLAVPTLVKPTQVSTSTYHSCAIDNQEVKCWGMRFGLLFVPEDLINPSQVFAGKTYNCFIDEGDLRCMGFLGKTSMGGKVKGLKKPIYQVSTGAEHICAIDQEGLKCWGG